MILRYLVQILEDGVLPRVVSPLRELEHVTNHGELDLAVAAGELLLPDLGAHGHRTFTFRNYFDKIYIFYGNEENDKNCIRNERR